MLCTVTPDRLGLCSFLLVVAIICNLLFRSLFVVVAPFPSFFFGGCYLLIWLLIYLISAYPFSFVRSYFFIFLFLYAVMGVVFYLPSF